MEKAVAKVPAAISGPVLVDSGPLLALFNGRDAWHTSFARWLQRNTQARLITSAARGRRIRGSRRSLAAAVRTRHGELA